MFKKYYKEANDQIETNRELIDKIFDEYSKSQSKSDRGKVYKFGIKYGTAFAAVLVLCVAVSVYPQISKLNDIPTTAEQQSNLNNLNSAITEEPKYAVENVASDVIAEDTNREILSKQSVQNNENDISNENNSISMARSTEQYQEQESRAKVIIDYQADISQLKEVSEEEIKYATDILIEKLGTADENTGNIYSFEISGKLEAEGKFYYLGRWKWLVDDHLSLICEFVLSDDLTELYECSIYDNNVGWTMQYNLFE